MHASCSSGGKVTAVDEFRVQAAGTLMSGRALLGPDETVLSADGTIDTPPRADNGPTGHVVIALEPAGTGSELTATSDDPGMAFRAVDSYADATGGSVKLNGTIRLGVPGLPLNASLTADRFVLKRSPMIAKIAALGSVGGVIDLLAADGLPFSQLAVTFTQRAGVINLTEAVGGSPGLALTARGTVDRAGDELSLDGTMVPNYAGLAQLVKDLPDVGGVVTTLGNERVKALDFSASGSLADPYVTAKPATGMSPTDPPRPAAPDHHARQPDRIEEAPRRAGAGRDGHRDHAATQEETRHAGLDESGPRRGRRRRADDGSREATRQASGAGASSCTRYGYRVTSTYPIRRYTGSPIGDACKRGDATAEVEAGVAGGTRTQLAPARGRAPPGSSPPSRRPRRRGSRPSWPRQAACRPARRCRRRCAARTASRGCSAWPAARQSACRRSHRRRPITAP